MQPKLFQSILIVLSWFGAYLANVSTNAFDLVLQYLNVTTYHETIIGLKYFIFLMYLWLFGSRYLIQISSTVFQNLSL